MTAFKKIGILLIISLFVLSFPNAHSASAEELTVSAAISLKNAFEEIGRIMETRQKSVKVLFNFGASGDLMRQIAAGAPVDVFASAAVKDMDDLDQQKMIRSGSRINFVGNSLVLIVPINSSFQGKSFQDLTDGRIKRIAVGHPKTVPAGRYAQEVLTYLKLWEGLKDKMILAENVRQVLDYVARGEVDAGLVYSTDARTRVKEIKILSTAPEESHKPILYPIGIVQGTNKENLAKEFIALVLSKEGKEILKRNGFKTL